MPLGNEVILFCFAYPLEPLFVYYNSVDDFHVS